MDGYKGFLGLLVSSLLVGFLSVIFTLIWVLHYREGLGWDGTALEFNWHPALMVTGFVFIQGIGTGHLLGGSGGGGTQRPGPGTDRSQPSGADVGELGGEGGARGASEGCPGAETAGRGGGTESGAAGAQTRDWPTWASGQRRPWGGARGRGARPDASGRREGRAQLLPGGWPTPLASLG